MNFQQLRIVRETVRSRFNLTEAASRLRTSQSGVSKHIGELEQELGVAIFVRKGKRLLGLTEPGRELAAVVERMLLDAENLKRLGRQFSDSDSGELVVATTHTQARYVLPQIIARFQKAFPNVRLVVHQASPKEIAARLLDGDADIGIATDTLENLPQLVTFPFHSWEHVVIVRAGHDLEKAIPLTLSAVARWPIITYDEGLTGRPRINQAFERAGLSPNISISALDSDVIKAYVQLGLGVGIVASVAFDAKEDRKLKALDSHGLFDPSTSRIAVRRGLYLRGYTYRFLELCSPQLTERALRAAMAD